MERERQPTHEKVLFITTAPELHALLKKRARRAGMCLKDYCLRAIIESVMRSPQDRGDIEMFRGGTRG